ncbi:MAG: molybdopterin-dependent oxidoreductase [Candidatus Erginobacter occultus]|nr:molybdopterin-dependent oxidoreductase [Candidatus Erginobacter occultus]
METTKVVGHSFPRIDGKEKVTGAAQYVDDLEFGPNLLYAEIIESPYPSALIRNIDASKAKKVPGVVAVVTGKDFPYKFGLYMQDRYILAQDRVRFVGEQVAAVIARDPKIAKRAAKLVKVDYKRTTPIFDQVKALKNKRTLIHPDLGEYEHVPWFFPKGGTNIAHHRKIRRGDLGKAFKESDVVLEDTYHIPRYAHCCMEPHIAVGLCDHSGRLTVWSSSQSPHTQRHLFVGALAPLGFTHTDVRVITPFIGGGFGGKAGVTMEILAAAFATKVKGMPVKVNWRRDQEFYNTYMRQAVETKIKIGATKDGKLTAFEMENFWDAGPYVEYGANVVNSSALSATGPYFFPALKIDSYCIYTNLPAAGPYRGFGYSEMLFSVESHIDRLAAKLGMSPLELRLKNVLKRGMPLTYGAGMTENDLSRCLNEVAKAIDFDKPEKSKDPNKVIGKGIASAWKGPAMPPNASSSAFLKFSEDGSLNILVSGIDMGQGLLTVMAQIAAEVLTVPMGKIRTECPDTDRNPYEWQTVASHVTWSCGNAVKRAALDARDRIFATIGKAYKYNPESLYLEDEQVKCHTDPDFAIAFKDFVIEGIMMEDGTFRGGPITGHGMFMPEFMTTVCDVETSQGGHPNPHYTVGAGGVVLEIDKETGKVKVLKAAEGFDCGRVLNPSLVEGQIIGGFMQGLATALYEDMRFGEDGAILNPNFTDYKIPTALDIPDKIIPIMGIESLQHDGPYGARGIGEHTMIPVAPAIANAVENALGIRIKRLPITAEKIALAIKEGRTEVE